MVKRDENTPAGGTALTRSGAVYRTLKRAILEQAVPPGAKLPEDSIGERLGVSRTLVREALLRLSTEGLVELRPNRAPVSRNRACRTGVTSSPSASGSNGWWSRLSPGG
jgi:DNA-binding GntR family transcriptional regulator